MINTNIRFKLGLHFFPIIFVALLNYVTLHSDFVRACISKTFNLPKNVTLVVL